MVLLISKNPHVGFSAAHKSDRYGVLKMIKEINYGHHFFEIINDNEISLKDDLNSYCCQEWEQIINMFIQKDLLQYVEVPNEIPTLCKCENKNV